MNEPTTYAVRVAIEQAVYDMIVEGEKKGIWRYKKPVPAVVKEEVKAEEKKDVVVEPQPISETKPEVELVSRVSKEVKVEEKKDVVVQSQTQSETKTIPSAATEVKADFFGTRVLKEDAYLYKEADDKSQRTWQLKKGTELSIISPGPEGWHLVRDAEKRKGFVKQDVLTNKQQ
jgi:uncharacterized protein YgiM (DUF1202 family)